MTRRSYSAAQRRWAILTVIDVGITRAAKELRIPYWTLVDWMAQAKRRLPDLFQGRTTGGAE